ncbi:MAG: DUF554 domain-containing protein [Bacteroidales bacterium]
MTGTLINASAILVGTLIGVLLKSKLPVRIVTLVFQSTGLFTFALGFAMSLKMSNFLLVVFSLTLGAIIGEGLNLEQYLENFSNWFKAKLKIGSEKFTEGMITAFLLYCMGSMTILGAFNEGMKGDSTLLITKSVMDGFASIALSSALGFGVGFSIIPLLVYQGGLTMFASYLGNFFTDLMISELTATGGILLIGMGFNILEIKRIKVFNLLPSLILIVFFTYLKQHYQLQF